LSEESSSWSTAGKFVFDGREPIDCRVVGNPFQSRRSPQFLMLGHAHFGFTLSPIFKPHDAQQRQ